MHWFFLRGDPKKSDHCKAQEVCCNLNSTSTLLRLSNLLLFLNRLPTMLESVSSIGISALCSASGEC